jgi:WXXGXW repeat (2 copies)
MHRLRFASLLSGLVLFGLMALAMPSPSSAQLGVSITIAPPMLPVYEQPVIPGPGYVWVPGYWAWSPEEGAYYWVPGTWVLPPEVGLLWTPGYWSWASNAFVWNVGYWAPAVGYYGGINYGYGYTGTGYEGGYWNGRNFFYNRAVNNIGNVPGITNVYNRTVVNNLTINNVSYNGGNGGTTARPTAAERAATSQRHIPPTALQIEQDRAASTNRALSAAVNHGKPPIAATSKPGQFSGRGVMAAREAAPYHPAAAAATNRGLAARAANPASAEKRPMAAGIPSRPGPNDLRV